jgi:hypothetical protein
MMKNLFSFLLSFLSRLLHAQLMMQRVGIPRASAAESYIQRYDKHLWERMKKYTFNSIEDGIQGLK